MVSRHLPIYEYETLEDFQKHIPINCAVIVVEMDGTDVRDFTHPERCIYLLGGEDRSVPELPYKRVKFPTDYCVNMAVASALILYDRILKLNLIK